MLIFAIDDEPKMLRALHRAIAAAEPDAEVRDFARAAEVLRAINEEGARPEVVFSDIEMPGIDGLELAVRIKDASPESRIIFVTGYPKYAAQAYRLHINGYILKPADAERVREELDALNLPQAPPEPDKLSVQCFGYFDVFWKGEPLIFKRTLEKELFAYLIDREGAACTSEEIISALWEDESDERAAKHRLRTIISELRKTLREIGMEKVLIRERRQTAVRRDMVDCDYYRTLDGDTAALNAYHGEYMKQYSWAELTTAKLHFRQTEGK